LIYYSVSQDDLDDERMESLLPLIGFLACPLGMGLCMWLMRKRGAQ